MRFSKMHGLGNDYVYVNAFHEHVPDPARLAVAISDRHTGIGSDGLILIRPAQHGDVRMEMYNADGSRAEMCGNGIRCVARYAVDYGLTPGPAVRIETDSGVRLAVCDVVDGQVRAVRVDMGVPSLAPASLPTTIPGERIVNHPLEVAGRIWPITCVSMGNPHAVVFVDDLSVIELAEVGPGIETAPEFPQRINVHFVQVTAPDHVIAKTWERGSGATRACGTGACAVCVAGTVTKRTLRRITATLPGGDLDLEWSADGHVFKTGPAVHVFDGDWPNTATPLPITEMRGRPLSSTATR